MLKYYLLIALNMPLVLLGVQRTVTSFRKGSLTKLGLAVWLVFWAVLSFGIIFAAPLFDFLQQNNLTASTPLSVFDVVLTTGVVIAVLLCLRLYTKLDLVERELHKLNREVSIRLAKRK